MEDKNNTSSKSVNSTELESSPVNLHQEEETETNAGSQGGSGGTAASELTTEVKRKRGRPRKNDGAAPTGSSPVSTPQGFSSSFSGTSNKRCRGRPKGSGKLQALASLGGLAMETAGGSFTPYVVTVPRGECLYRKIQEFSLMGSRAICILSATGDISSVGIRQPGSSGGFVRYQGQFEILSLNGSLITDSMGRRSSELSISLAKPTGRVFGGKVAGSVIAATPIQLVVASFKQNIMKDLKKRQSAESSTAASVFGNSDMVRVPIPIAAMTTDYEEHCTTPTSVPSETFQGGEDAISAGNQNSVPALLDGADPAPLNTFYPDLMDSSDQKTLQPESEQMALPSQPVSDRRKSPIDSADQNTLQPLQPKSDQISSLVDNSDPNSLQLSQPKSDASLVESSDPNTLQTLQPVLDQKASPVDSSGQNLMQPSRACISDQMAPLVDSSDQNTLQLSQSVRSDQKISSDNNAGSPQT